MLRARLPILVAFATYICACLSAHAQDLTKQVPQDYATEPYVIEALTTTVSFTNNGTSTQKFDVRVRIQSAGGIQEFGLLRYAYPSSIGDAEFSFVKVTKPDGRVIETPREDIRDMPTQITVAAPFYSDLKEKQVPVKGLEIGDILEYENQFHGQAPLVPGQFFLDFNFFTQGIVLHEELHVQVPLDRIVKLKSSTVQPLTTEENGYRNYVWKTSNLERLSEDDKKKKDAAEPTPPSVQLSSFGSWEEVAQWYAQLLGSFAKLDDDDKSSEPIKLETPGDYMLNATVRFPANLSPQERASVDVKKDFAEYHASYSWEGGAWHVQRRLSINMREIPRTRSEEYRAFWKEVNGDQVSLIALSHAKDEELAGSPAAPKSEVNPDIEKLMAQAIQAYGKKDKQTALDSLKSVLGIDPKFAGAWSMLGDIDINGGEVNKGIDEEKKAIELDPQLPVAYEDLGVAYSRLRRFDDALDAWRKAEKLAPDDSWASGNIGLLLVQKQQFSEAVPKLEAAVKDEPKNPAFVFGLGKAYMASGAADKGADTFRSLLEIDASPNTLNSVAYELAERGSDLNDALQYATKAVAELEEKTSDIFLANLSVSDLREMNQLAAYWDTLAWTQFRLGNMKQAEPYALAAWSLSQAPIMANHLGQIYEKNGNKDEAAHSYAFALAAGGAAPEGANDRLTQLLGNKARADQAVNVARNKLAELRTTKLPRLIKGQGRAEFFVLISRASNGITSSKFISGSDELKNAASTIISAGVPMSFPDDQDVRLVRRGIVDCEANSSACQFVLLTPDSVNSVN